MNPAAASPSTTNLWSGLSHPDPSTSTPVPVCHLQLSQLLSVDSRCVPVFAACCSSFSSLYYLSVVSCLSVLCGRGPADLLYPLHLRGSTDSIYPLTYPLQPSVCLTHLLSCRGEDARQTEEGTRSAPDLPQPTVLLTQDTVFSHLPFCPCLFCSVFFAGNKGEASA